MDNPRWGAPRQILSKPPLVSHIIKRMATAPVSIAPVLTPHTLGVLADTFENDHLPEQALFLRKLLPFIEGVVEKCFSPLVSEPGEHDFLSRFSMLATDFELFRLMINVQLFTMLVNQNLLWRYEQVLLDTLDPLMRTAREMDMGPELIAAAVRDYIKIFRAIRQAAETATIEGSELTVNQFTELPGLFHAATRFDYGLTATFLILERSIPVPNSRDKGALLSACRESLSDFGQAISRVFVHENIKLALQDLETPRIRIEVVRNGVEVTPEAKRSGFPFGSSRRHIEMSWIKRHKDLTRRYGGQWIVLEKDELIANDRDYRKARGVATQRGIRRPFIIFVPPSESGGFMGI